MVKRWLVIEIALLVGAIAIVWWLGAHATAACVDNLKLAAPDDPHIVRRSIVTSCKWGPTPFPVDDVSVDDRHFDRIDRHIDRHAIVFGAPSVEVSAIVTTCKWGPTPFPLAAATWLVSRVAATSVDARERPTWDVTMERSA